MAGSLVLLALCGLAVSNPAVEKQGEKAPCTEASAEFCEVRPVEVGRIVGAIGGSYDPDDPASVPNQLHPDRLPATLDFGRLELPSETPRTDVLSVDFLPPFGMLVSERAKQVLDAFDIAPHAAYPVTVLHRGQEHSYVWIQLVPEKTPIDFARSIFSLHPIEEVGPEAEIRFASLEELEAHDATHEVEILPKAILLEEKASSDLLALPCDLQIYASIRLVRAIREAGLTGFELAATRKIYTSDDSGHITASLP